MTAPGRSLDLGRRKSDNLCDPHDLPTASETATASLGSPHGIFKSVRYWQVVLLSPVASPLPTLSCHHTWTGETTKEAFPPPSP